MDFKKLDYNISHEYDPSRSFPRDADVRNVNGCAGKMKGIISAMEIVRKIDIVRATSRDPN